MNILTRSMLWTIWLLSMRHIVYVACEHVQVFKVMAYGASYEYKTSQTTNKNMSLCCVDVIATFIKVAAILKKKPVTGKLY